jgi:tetratricopeptide (TPR) repeat protein
MVNIISDFWEWFRDENNRAAAIALASGAFVLTCAISAGAWKVFVHFHRRKDEGGSATTNITAPTHGPNSPGSVHGPVTYHQGGVDSETFKKVINQYEQRISHLEGKFTGDVPLSDAEKASISAAIQRVATEAEAGDPQAKAAIEQTRATGDITKLTEFFDREIAKWDEQIREQAPEWLALHHESAAIAFLRGHIDKAQSRLETILRFFPNNLDTINRLGHIHHLRGRLPEAEQSCRRILELAGCDDSWHAVGYGNLGLIMRSRGDLDEAERMHRKALAIDEKLARLVGMADNYGNLGLIMRIRGDLDEAERMHRKALAINEKLGRLVGMANQYGNLGLIMRIRGDLDEAERMLRKALAIDEKLGRLEGKAGHYGNLGFVMQTRGDLDEAERMHHKALAIDEKLGRLEGIATTYGNLGIIMQARCDLDGAERLHRKALEIDEKLGRLEGMANHYGNLGIIYRTRGALPGARELWTKSRDLFARIGMKHKVEQVQGWLDALPAE